jgi:KDO2-lipid IV(A) lauroyltransferase
MPPPIDARTPAPPEGRSAWWLHALAALPWSALYGLAAVLAFLLRHVLRYRVGVARANLRRCFPELADAQINALLGAYYRQLGQIAVEVVRIVRMPAEEMRARVPVVDFEPVQAELDAGRSVLLLAAHQCNWEWALQAITLRLGVPLDAAYKPLHAPRADRQLRCLRTRYGAHLVAAKKIVREIARQRGQQHGLALMADQMPSSSGSRQWLRFLGTDTAFYPGPGEIARISGYAAFFVAMRRTARGRYECRIEPLAAAGERLEPAQFTARYARCVEAQIRGAPADWTWAHRRWKLQPPQASDADGASSAAAPR